MLHESVNLSADPCDNFYEYACGRWSPSFDPHVAYSSTFTELAARVKQQTINALLDPHLENDTTPLSLQVTAHIFRSCLEKNKISADDVTRTVIRQLDSIGEWPLITENWTQSSNDMSLSSMIGRITRRFGVTTLLAPSVLVDWRNTTRNALYFDEPTTLFQSSRRNSCSEVEKYVLAEYMAIVAAVLMGSKDLVTEGMLDEAQEAAEVECMMAQMLSNVSENGTLQYVNLYHHYTYPLLKERWQAISWDEYLTELLDLTSGSETTKNHSDISYIVLYPSVMDQVNRLIEAANKNATFQRLTIDYLLFAAIQNFIPFLSRTKDLTINDTCYDFVTSGLPFAVGRLHLGRKYNDQKKQLESELVSTIAEQFETQLKQAKWMDPVTRRLAVTKLRNMVRNVAYPDWMMSDADLDTLYSGLSRNVHPDDNFMICSQKVYAFQEAMAFDDLFRRPNRRDFVYSPAIVNAWYIPSYNSLTVPAAILNPDVFATDFPMATNYAAAGFVIGHEMTHGFDPTGVQFFVNGTLKTWITKRSRRRFTRYAHCFVEQYDKFCFPEVGLDHKACVNGEQTLSENIADNGGIRAAFYAYQRYAEIHPDERRKHLPGFNHLSMNQLFFVSFAHTFCASTSTKALARLLATDVHSPPEARVLGTLSNLDEFSITFGCKPWQHTRTLKRCDMW